jgi:hypothetical protein
VAAGPVGHVLLSAGTLAGELTPVEQLSGQAVTQGAVSSRPFTQLPAAGTIEQGAEAVRMMFVKFKLAAESSAPPAAESLRGLSLVNLAPVASPDEAQDRPDRVSFTSTGAVELSGVVMSAGFVAWALRGGGLLATLAASVPAWRNVDPLPVLAPEDDKPHWKSDDDDQATPEKRALSRLLSAKPLADDEGEIS